MRLDSTKPVSWPRVCAVCCAPAETLARVSQTSATGYYLIAYTQKTQSINFPVCKKHRILCAVLNRPSRWGFVGSFLALLFIPGILWISTIITLAIVFGLKGDALDPYLSAIGVLFFGSMFAFLLLAPRLQPVRLAADKQTLTFRIKNEEYFHEFRRLNADAEWTRSG